MPYVQTTLGGAGGLTPSGTPDGAVAKPRRGPVQTFGLDFRVVLLTFLVDALAFSGDVVSAGLLYPVELVSAVVLGFITYKIQKSWYGDDHDSALIKALVIALVTAIPLPVAPLLAGGGGILGTVGAIRGRR